MKKFKLFGVLGCLAFFLTGCKNEDDVIVMVDEEGNQVEEAVAPEDLPYLSPDEVAPRQGEGGMAAVPALPGAPAVPTGASSTEELFKGYNDDGETMSVVDLLQQVVDSYEQTRIVSVVDDSNPQANRTVPPLTNLQQLVSYRFIRALPAAPTGQKYTLDVQTMTVKTVSK